MKRKTEHNGAPAAEEDVPPEQADAKPTPLEAAKNQPTERRGFANMERDKLRKWASYGGMVAQANGLAHRFNAETARQAGRKGGLSIARDRSYMADLGRRGGIAKREARRRMQQRAEQDGGLVSPEPISHDGEGTADVPQVEASAQLGERGVVEITSPTQRRSPSRRQRKDT